MFFSKVLYTPTENNKVSVDKHGDYLFAWAFLVGTVLLQRHHSTFWLTILFLVNIIMIEFFLVNSILFKTYELIEFTIPKSHKRNKSAVALISNSTSYSDENSRTSLTLLEWRITCITQMYFMYENKMQL